jgi:hypothetical protein
MFHLNVKKYGLLLACLLLFVSNSFADVLELKSGKFIKGSYMGGTQSSIRFQENGELKVIPTSEILAITFTALAAAAPAQTQTPSSGQAVQSKSTLNEIPPGTTLLVKTSEVITTKNKKAGSKFSAILQNKLLVGTVEVAPAGATVYGEVLKAAKGGIGKRRAVLEITLTQILIDGELKQIKTTVLTGEGPKGGLGRKIIKGAVVGALADGSRGAEDGAKIGVGIGVLAGGKHAGISQGEVIEFSLIEKLSL